MGDILTRIDTLIERLSDADQKFLATIVGIVDLLRDRPPTDDRLRVAKRRWITGIPSFGCVSVGPTPTYRNGTLRIVEDRAVLGAATGSWVDPDGPRAVAIVRISLVAPAPRGLAIRWNLLARFPVADVAAWLDAHPTATDEDALNALAADPPLVYVCPASIQT